MPGFEFGFLLEYKTQDKNWSTKILTGIFLYEKFHCCENYFPLFSSLETEAYLVHFFKDF